MPKGHVVGDTNLGRERDLIPSLPGGGERVVLLGFVVVAACVVYYFLYVSSSLSRVPTSPFIVQGEQVYKG
jgi:hypothetical protein